MDAPTFSLDHLRNGFVGAVLTPGDAAFDEARRVWNAMIDRKPGLIARCRGTSDVMRAVRFAGANGLGVAIRGGGHNVAGHAVCDGNLMVDLSEMRGVQVDPARMIAIVEGGATWADVDRETQAFGLATPGGLISETGVAGLTLSGGFGYLRGRHGLSIDNLIAADVIVADGSLVRAAKRTPNCSGRLKAAGETSESLLASNLPCTRSAPRYCSSHQFTRWKMVLVQSEPGGIMSNSMTTNSR